jgi:hypothetical protein
MIYILIAKARQDRNTEKQRQKIDLDSFFLSLFFTLSVSCSYKTIALSLFFFLLILQVVSFSFSFLLSLSLSFSHSKFITWTAKFKTFGGWLKYAHAQDWSNTKHRCTWVENPGGGPMSFFIYEIKRTLDWDRNNKKTIVENSKLVLLHHLT